MANQKHNATLRIGAALDRSVGQAFKGVSANLKAVSKSISEVEKRQREMAKTRADLVKQGKAVDDLDREYEQLGRTLQSLQGQHRRLERLDNAISRVGGSFEALRTTAVRTGKAVGAAMAGITAGAVATARATAEYGAEMQRMATLSNTGTSEFQRWAAAARSVGIEEDKLSDILKDVNDRVGDFVQTGGGPMADFFEKIGPKVGVTAEDFRKLSGPQALQLYVSSLEKAKVNQQDFTFYLEAMASDSTLLLPLLRNNGAEMDRLGDAAARAGVILDEQAIAASVRYRQEWSAVGNAMRGVRNIIGVELIPVMTELASKARVWIEQHGPQIREVAARIGSAIRDGLPHVIEFGNGLFRIADAGVRMAATAADAIGGWENFGMALGAAFTLPLLFRIGAFAVALTRVGWAITAMGVAMAANPVGAAIAVLAVGATLLIANWSKVKPYFDWLWGKVKAAFTGARDAIRPVVDWLGGAADTLADGWQAFADSMSNIMTRVGDAFERAKTRAVAVVEWFKSNAAALDRATFGNPHGENATFRDSPIGSVREGSFLDRVLPGGKPQARAVGGAFEPGPLRVGERGEELVYASSRGYVAHNRALRGMEQRATRIRDMAQAASGALSPPRQAPRSAAGPVNITINQLPGQDPMALVREIKRQLRGEGRGDLFDGIHA